MSKRKKNNDLPRATMEQAKAAWEAHPCPSIRTVAHALFEAGLELPIATLQRWRKKGNWKLAEPPGKREGEAKAKTMAKADAIEKTALAAIDIIEVEEDAMKELAKQLQAIESDSELARQTMRKSLIAQNVLSEQIIRRASYIAGVAPGKIAGMIDALKGPAASTTIVMPPDQQHVGANGDGARVVEGRLVTEESPTSLAIAAFRQRTKQGVAA